MKPSTRNDLYCVGWGVKRKNNRIATDRKMSVDIDLLLLIPQKLRIVQYR